MLQSRKSKLAIVWLKDGQGMEDQEESIKNKKYRSLKMFPSDIILKFKNIVKSNQNKLIKLKNSLENNFIWTGSVTLSDHPTTSDIQRCP